MNANELRIGNYIMFDGQITPVSLLEIVNLSSGQNSFKYLYKPIQLTTEWLEKFGIAQLRHMPTCWQHPAEDFCIEFDEGEFWQEHEYDSIGISIDYVHQLQNRFYALYGTELEISK